MAYVAAVQAYGADPEDVAESGGVPSPDPVAPESVHVPGVASEITRNWLTGLEVSPRGSSSPILKLHGAHVPTVDNLIAGTNVSLVKAGRDVTISASGGGGGGGGGKGIEGAYDIEAGGAPGYIDAGLSDEMDSGSLNPAWTVQQGSAGTINMLSTVSAATYNLSARPKGMLVQTPNTANSEFRLRAPVIAVNEEIIVSTSTSNVPPNVNNAYHCGVSITSGAGNHYDGNSARMYIDGSDNGTIVLFDGTNVYSSLDVGRWGGRMYWRIVRTASGFHFYYSIDGTAWVPMGRITVASAAYVWIYAGSLLGWTRNNGGDPITAINWIRHKAYSGLDPW